MPSDSSRKDASTPSRRDRPEFLIDGWRGFIARAVFSLAVLGLLGLTYIGAMGFDPN